MAPDGDKALSHAEYWDDQYTQGKGHEWFRSFTQLETFFQKHVFAAEGFKVDDQPSILHLGSGESSIPAELASRGYRKQLCVDFSQVIVDLMAERHASDGVEWRHMDVRKMDTIADKSIDVAFDKGTLDAMIYGSPWSPPDDVLENTGEYLREVHRVLKDSGIFLYVTFRQPHFVTRPLDQGDLWNREMDVLGESGSFDYYGFLLRKH